MLFISFFFFKQKTAYELRISDWSSDVCSSDLFYKCFRGVQYADIPDRPYDFVFSDGPERRSSVNGDKLFDLDLIHVVARSDRPVREIGRASCRERVCQYV